MAESHFQMGNIGQVVRVVLLQPLCRLSPNHRAQPSAAAGCPISSPALDCSRGVLTSGAFACHHTSRVRLAKAGTTQCSQPCCRVSLPPLSSPDNPSDFQHINPEVRGNQDREELSLPAELHHGHLEHREGKSQRCPPADRTDPGTLQLPSDSSLQSPPQSRTCRVARTAKEQGCRSGAAGAHLEEALELLVVLLKNLHVQVELQAVIHGTEVPCVQGAVCS